MYQLRQSEFSLHQFTHSLSDVVRSLARRIILSFVVCALVLAATSAPTNAKRIKVLILGDSVASVLRWSPPSMKPLWKNSFDVTLEVWGCQKLVDPGCIEGAVAQPSALDIIRHHRGEKFDIIVVATGYNDTGDAYLKKSIHRIHSEVKKQKADLLWLTYRENGNVKIKMRTFNKVVKTEAKRLKFAILDWELIARKQKHWFNGDGVHMNAHGGIRLGNHLSKALTALATGTPITSTTAPSVNG